MKSIKALLRQMNENNLYTDDNYHIEIYSDGSGRIAQDYSEIVVNFSSTEEMQRKLDEIHAKLSLEKPNNWAL